MPLTAIAPDRDAAFDLAREHALIASYLALTPETVCRTLRQMREFEVIEMPRKDRIVTQDARQLAITAEIPPS